MTHNASNQYLLFFYKTLILKKWLLLQKNVLEKMMKMESFFKVIYQNTLQNFLSRSHSRRDSIRQVKESPQVIIYGLQEEKVRPLVRTLCLLIIVIIIVILYSTGTFLLPVHSMLLFCVPRVFCVFDDGRVCGLICFAMDGIVGYSIQT